MSDSRTPTDITKGNADRRHARCTRRRWLVAACCVGLIIAVGGSALALAASTSKRSQADGVVPASTPAPVVAVDPQLAAVLSAFQRPQEPGDVPPADIITPDMLADGANPQLARLAGEFSGQSVYLVPADGGICLASSSLLAAGCFTTAEILADEVQETLACWPYMPADQQEVFGLLPDASSLHASYSDGTVHLVQLSSGVYVVNAEPSDSPYPMQLSWSGSNGPGARSTGLPVTLPHPCTPATLSPDGATPSEAIARARARIEAGEG